MRNKRSSPRNQVSPVLANLRDERGIAAVEYAIMLVLIALSVAAFGQGMSGSVTGVFEQLIQVITG